MPPPQLSRRAAQARGQPISYLMEQALACPNLISLAAGFVDQESLPVEATRQAFEALWSNPAQARSALQYGTTPGDPLLRERLLAELVAADGPSSRARKATVEQLLLTAGSNEFLHVLADTLFDPGDIVLTTSPSYFVFLGLVTNLGMRAVGVEADDEGLVPEALDDELRRLDAAGELPRVKAIYVVSYFDNPRGVTLAAARRPMVVELAKRWSRHGTIYVIDDMAYRELRYAGDDVPSLRSFDETGDTVVAAHTFSKSFSPGLRVGYGLLPKGLVGPVSEQKGNIDFGSPHFNQRLVATMLGQGTFWPHVERLRAGYRLKLAAMLAGCEEHLAPLAGVRWLQPKGGLYVWLELPEHVDAGPGGRLFEAAMREGVLYVPGEHSFPSEGRPVRRSTARLSFGVQTCEQIGLGIAALARAVRAVVDQTRPKAQNQ
ncbi:MAG TPA: PLP-dependent aminotransferase family protein [Pirellulales bacterium]|nr:PLP-dependent aminotransferase family protein [Pirellulales bacterium]